MCINYSIVINSTASDAKELQISGLALCCFYLAIATTILYVCY